MYTIRKILQSYCENKTAWDDVIFIMGICTLENVQYGLHWAHVSYCNKPNIMFDCLFLMSAEGNNWMIIYVIH